MRAPAGPAIRLTAPTRAATGGIVPRGAGLQHPRDLITTTKSLPLKLTHGPHPRNTKHFPGGEFLALADHENRGTQPFVVPYRSLYSRNVENLFVAGRCISVTHVALGQVRVQRNTGTMGEAVGLAAAVCKKRPCTPRTIYPQHWEDLTALFLAE